MKLIGWGPDWAAAKVCIKTAGAAWSRDNT